MLPLIARTSLFLILFLGFPTYATAAPLCAGASSVTALGAVGCELGGVTFSDFSITGASTFGTADPNGVDPHQILIEIVPGTINLDIITRLPAIEVRVRPSTAANWTVPGSGGIGGSLSLTLNYTMTTSGDTLDQYQLRAFGNSAFRGGGWNVTQDPSNGSGPHSERPSQFAMPIGTFDPGTTSSNVTNSLGVSSALFFTGSVSSFVNAYTLLQVPEPGVLLLLSAAGVFARLGRRTPVPA